MEIKIKEIAVDPTLSPEEHHDYLAPGAGPRQWRHALSLSCYSQLVARVSLTDCSTHYSLLTATRPLTGVIGTSGSAAAPPSRLFRGTRPILQAVVANLHTRRNVNRCISLPFEPTRPFKYTN